MAVPTPYRSHPRPQMFADIPRMESPSHTPWGRDRIIGILILFAILFTIFLLMAM